MDEFLEGIPLPLCPTRLALQRGQPGKVCRWVLAVPSLPSSSILSWGTTSLNSTLCRQFTPGGQHPCCAFSSLPLNPGSLPGSGLITTAQRSMPLSQIRGTGLLTLDTNPSRALVAAKGGEDTTFLPWLPWLLSSVGRAQLRAKDCYHSWCQPQEREDALAKEG